MRDLKTKLIEAKDELGGRMLIYPEKMIWDVGGVTPILCEINRPIGGAGEDVRPHPCIRPAHCRIGETSGFNVHPGGGNGEKHWTRTVILAIGRGILRMAKLELEGAERYEVSNLHYTVQELEPLEENGSLYREGNSAVDWANELVSIAAQVTVVHRRDHFGGHEKRRSNEGVFCRCAYAI